MERTTSPVKRLSTVMLAFAMLLGLSAVGSVALAGPSNVGRVYIDKVDEAGAPVVGAQLQIQNANGEIVQQFASTGTTMELMLPVGDYHLIETQAPEGYEASAPVAFSVTPDEYREKEIIHPAKQLPVGYVQANNQWGMLDGGFSVYGGGLVTKVFCVDATIIDPPIGQYTSEPIHAVRGLSAEELLRILYVGYFGNANGWGQQIRPAEDFDQGTQFWLATQYAIISYTNGEALAQEYYGKYLGPNRAIAEQIKASAHDSSIEIPEGYEAYIYSSHGNQPCVAASFPEVQEKVIPGEPTQVRMVDTKSTGQGEVYIEKVSDKSVALPGAHLQIINEQGAVVQDFVTDGSRMHFTLPVGRYVLHEVSAPSGYLPSPDIQFTVTADGKDPITGEPTGQEDVRMVDTEQRSGEGEAVIEKTDANGNPLAGAVLQILDAAGNVVYEFESTGQPMKFKLAPGNYILHEVSAPAGYEKAADIPFSVEASSIVYPASGVPDTLQIGSDCQGLPDCEARKGQYGAALEFVNVGGSWAPAYCIEHYKGAPANLPNGETYHRVDLDSYDNQYAMVHGKELVEALRRIAYFGYGNDAAGIIEQFGKDWEASPAYQKRRATLPNGTYMKQDATRYAMAVMNHYNITGRFADGRTFTDAFGKAILGPTSSISGGVMEREVIQKLIDLALDKSVQIPDNFKVAIYQSADSSKQQIIVGYWTSVVMADEKSKAAIRTTAVDSETKEHMAYADGEVTIVDTVAYEGLEAGKVYTLKGELKKKSDGSTIATAETQFQAKGESGTTDIEFTFDGTALKGDAAVAFESLYDMDGTTLIAEHKDIEDLGQTVVFPEAQTTATDKSDGDHAADAGPITIVDKVTYRNLIVGKEYTVSGTLMKKSDGKPLVIDGKPVTATKTFTAQQKDGYVELEFTFDASALAGEKIVAFEKVSYNDEVVAVHEDIEDEEQSIIIEEKPWIGTTATDGTTGDHIGYAGANTTLVDVVAYHNLKGGQVYTVKGQLMKRADSTPIPGATAEAQFQADASGEGTVELTFTFDATALRGFASVAFEELYDANGQLVAEHKDIKDEGQTVYYPDIHTTAIDKADGDKVVHPNKKTTVVDTVAYTNLVPGKEYKVSGTLMRKSTGEPLVINGKPVTAEKTFKAEKKNGTVDVEFVFDATSLGSTTLVVFEKLYIGEDCVAVHEDINDADQTIIISENPQIRTQAKDKLDDDNEIEAEPGQTIVDTVIYSNLEKGKEYTVRGTLMDKGTNAPVMNGNNKVVASKTFKAEDVNGTVDVEFNFDATGLDGHTLVVFEKLFDADGDQIAKHENINDAAQTIIIPEEELVPEISTTATDSATGEHMANADSEVTIVDVVSYAGLQPAKEYTLKGKLVRKADKGVVATAERTFTTSETGEGTVDLSFTFNGKSLAGSAVVAFEQVWDGDQMVVAHEDINDEGQTVVFPKAETTATDKEDGDHKADPDEKITVVDKVTYSNLIIGKEYKVSGTLMKKSDGKPLVIDGKPVTAEKTFTATKKNGYVELEFTFPASALAGEKIVAFEKVYYNDEVVAVHEDITDEEQTIIIEDLPEIGTTATDNKDGDKYIEIGKTAEVKDVVAYQRLKPGKEYTLSGKLVTKSSGGEKVVAEASTTFKAAASGNGEVELVFTVDTRKIVGEKLVAFETVSLDGKEIATHADINDLGQTVTVEEQPEIEKYVNKEVHQEIDLDEVFTYDVIAYITKDADRAEIYDTLVPDLQFVSAASDVKVVDLGTTVDHKPHGSVEKDGPAVAEAKADIKGQKLTVTIDPATAYRGHWLKMTFDAKIKDGLTIEDLKYVHIEKNDPVITDEKHEGVPNTSDYKIWVDNEGKYTDESNTVTVKPRKPEIGTTATDEATKDHIAAGDAGHTIVDVVAYSDLKPNATFTLKGELKRKSNGETIATSEATFRSSASGSGLTTLTFENIDLSNFKNDAVVVFEELYKANGKLIAVHKDINDEGQTIVIPEAETTATDKEDGNHQVDPDAKVTVVDKVTYRNLIIGKEYTVSGTLMKKSDGQPLVIDGKPVTATKTFTAEKKNGYVELEFTFNASALSGEKLVAFEKVYYNDEVVAVHEDLEDEEQTVVIDDLPEIGTTATDNKDGDKEVEVGEVEVKDVVSYKNLKVGKEYTLSGKLVTKSSGGKTVVAEATKTFKPAKRDGSVELVFTVDTSKLAGEKLVAFETLSLDGTEVATHADIKDEGQTVVVDKIPEIGTTATDAADGDKEVEVGTVEVKDVVSYINLKPGKEYTIEGKLVTKSSKGKKVVAEASKAFTPESENGTVELVFTVDTSKLAGEKLVAFETLKLNGIEVATHADINDAGQTVVVDKIPEIGTTATDNKDGDKEIEVGTVEVKDVVSYRNLKPGKEYTVKGQLVTKSSKGEKVVAEAETTFTPAAENGTVELVFTVDTKDLAGEQLVAFEHLYRDGVEVATHADIDDEGQTVTVDDIPEIGTTASDASDGNKIVDIAKDVKVKDVVSYTGLKPGKEYTLNGKLVTKKSAGAIVVAEATKTFVPEAKNGSVELVFTVDTTKYAGQELVVFESLVLDGVEVATHADINDEGQTVVVDEIPEIGTTASDKADGDKQVDLGTVEVKDVVAYKNLKPGKEYTLSGKLVTKSSGGKTVVAKAEKKFTPKAANGKVEMVFEVDTTKYAGEKLVAFETVSLDGVEVAVHADINDEGQTVVVDEIPEIGTTATDKADGDKQVDLGTVEVKDVVAYKHLKPGKEYTLSGKLVTKSSKGKTVVAKASKKFTPETADGTVEMIFKVDTTKYAGEKLVAFETVSLDGVEVAVHADINDEGQTVVVDEKPEIGTTASAAIDGGKAVEIGTVEVKDVVTYINLKPGKEYTLKGQLVTRASDGKTVISEAETTFTPATANGTVDLIFTVDTSKYAGEKLVAFEHLYCDGVEVAAHADINDKGQTVTVDEQPEIGTTATDNADGDKQLDLGTVEVKDVVSYINLKPGKEYTLSGKLVTKSSGGQKVVAEATKTFVPEAAVGTVELVFTVDTKDLAGEELVAFETVSRDGIEVATHADINDEGQTVVVDEQPEIGTTATDKRDGDKYVEIGTVEVKDVVAYKNLKPGKEYTLSGKLVKKADQSVVAEATRTFTPEAANGAVELVFTVDTRALKGEKLVAFETVSLDGTEVATHADINDEGQTVTVDEQPEIEKYVNKQVHDDIDLDQVFTYDVLAYITKDADKAEITDTLVDDLQFVSSPSDVKVVDLGETVDHTPHGSVEQDGPAVAEAKATINGQTLKVTIDPANAHRGHWVKMTFDAKIKDGLTLDDLQYVVIEKNDPVISDETHEGVPNDASYKIWVDNEGKYTDESNTVTVKPKEPEIGTTATDAKDGDKYVEIGNVEVKDVVEYKDLKANTNYQMSGQLVTKASGGAKVVAEQTVDFTTDATGCGTVELVFTVDTSKLVGEKLVAFEKAIEVAKGAVVATHEDINDEGQTVTVDEVPEIEKYVNKEVHQDIDLDEVFTYDVIAYITRDADKAEITDTLVDDLQFVSAPGDVKLVDLGETVDHMPHGSVENDGPEVAHVAAIDGQTLTVTIDPANEYRGHWVKMTFDAKIKDGLTLDDLQYVVIEKNDPVITDETHEGVPNDASYRIWVNNEGKYSDESNTVTVKPRQPEIGTVATDSETDDHIAPASDGRTIVDVVAYSDLKPGAEYTIKGELKRKSDGATIATAEASFVASETGSGVATVIFEADLAALAGDALVAFEEAYDVNGKLVAEHKDLYDEEQTVYVPSAETLATDQTDGDHYIAPDEKVTVVDEVSYTNLIPGKEYTVNGTLHIQNADGTDGGPLDVEGATASVTFVPEYPNGTVELEFTFDASALAGQKIVAFEEVSYNGVIVAVHEDITDVAQTIEVRNPEIGTEAQYSEGDPKVIDLDQFFKDRDEVELVDTVTYTGLEPGKEYTLKGTLMDAATSQPVMVEAVPEPFPVTAEVTFVAENENGEVKVPFTLMERTLLSLTQAHEEAGTGVASLVVFEQLFEGDKQIAKHEDISDEKQTVGTKETRRGESSIEFAKVDENGDPVAGAKLQLTGTLESDGSEFPAIEWVTDGQPFQVDNMPAGTYTLTELEAPEGYLLADPIEFVLDDHGNVFIDGEQVVPDAGVGNVVVTMVDRLIPDDHTPSPSPSEDVTPTPTPTPTPGKVTPSKKSVAPNSVTPIRTTSRLPVTGLSKTGASTGVALGMGAVLLGLGAVLVRRREIAEK